jgi:putative ABC transport system permease protein
MMLLDALGLAARGLHAHRFRALLTLLSVSIGAFAIVLMSSLAQSGFETIKHGIEEVGGATMILIVPKTPERAEARARAYRLGLTEADRDRVLEGVPHLSEYTLYGSFGSRDVTGDSGALTSADLLAGDQRFADAMRLRIGSGRGFEPAEHREHARVCVVSQVIADELWHGAAPGRQLTIGGVRCRVTGVFAPNQRFGFSIGFEWDRLVLIPAETGGDYFSDMPQQSLLLLKTDAVSSNDVVKRIVNARLADRHHGVDDFSFIDFAGLLRKFYAAFLIMEVIAGCLAGVALLIGGVGIMNMMLVSVNERVREIGIQKAIGARPAQLRAQFLSEAVLLSLVGGLGGVLAGVGLSQLASTLIVRVVSTWVGLVSWNAVLAALLSAAGTGVVFGWLPARRAAQLSPVEAMRR